MNEKAYLLEQEVNKQLTNIGWNTRLSEYIINTNDKSKYRPDITLYKDMNLDKILDTCLIDKPSYNYL